LRFRSLLPDGWRLDAVTYPGREDRLVESAAPTLRAMAQSIAEEIADTESCVVVLFGHSFGATVAFEVAVSRQAAGLSTALLAVSASGPGSGRGFLTARIGPGPESFNRLARQVIALDPESADALSYPDIRAVALSALSYDLDLLESHVLSRTILKNVPVLTLAGRNDPSVTPASVHSWAALTTGHVIGRDFDGGHFYFRHHASAVLKAIGAMVVS
jgi:pyochelin biosynthetic protein PchC